MGTNPKQPNAYAQAGVDVDIEAEASRMMFRAAQATFVNREGDFGEVIVPFEDFAGVRAIDVGNLPEGSLMSMGFDGVGTKVELAERMNKHDTIAFDLFAMVCDDAVVRGAEPVLVGSNLDLTTLGTDDRYLPIMEELCKGYVEAAREANVAVINGEIAQLPSRVKGYREFAYNWGAALVWFVRKEKMFTGMEIGVGDAVVMLREKGFRSNGISLVRKTFKKHYGDTWHEHEFEGKALGLHALHPSTIYSRLVVSLHGGFMSEGSTEIHGVVHITGGGIIEKCARVLRPSGLGMRLDTLFAPCSAMQHCQHLADLPDADAYKTWNMGQGMAIITPQPEQVVAGAKEFGVEAVIAGEIIEEHELSFVSQGEFQQGERIVVPLKD